MKNQFFSILLFLSFPVFAQTKPDPLDEVKKDIKKIADQVDEWRVMEKDIATYKKDSIRLSKDLSNKQKEVDELGEKLNASNANDLKNRKTIDSLTAVIKSYQQSEKKDIEAEINAIINDCKKTETNFLTIISDKATDLKAAGATELKNILEAVVAFNQAKSILEKPYKKDMVEQDIINQIKLLNGLSGKIGKYPILVQEKNNIVNLLVYYCNKQEQIYKIINRARTLDAEAKLVELNKASEFTIYYPYLNELVDKEKTLSTKTPLVIESCQ